MKKRDIIKESSTFNSIINNGKKIKNKYYNVFFINNNIGRPLFGIAVGKKIGNAVLRNKNKRQIKSIIDNNMSFFSNSCYYIIMLKKEINELDFQDKEKFLISLISKGEKNEE